MAKIIDISDKLEFGVKPKIKILREEMEVNTDAVTVLKVMQIIKNGENLTVDEVIEVYELIFTEKDRKKIDKLSLSFTDFQTVVKTAIGLVTGDEDKEQGE